MAYDDLFRLSSHAVIADDRNRILQLKANYGDCNWGLPGGALDKGETIHEALMRECYEELGSDVKVHYLSGVYFHRAFNSQAFIFRCELLEPAEICLSEEHTEYRYTEIEELSEVQQKRVRDCLNYTGATVSKKF